MSCSAARRPPRWIAPHFVWAVRDELADKLCGVGVPSCDALDLGGLRVTTTLDVGLQKIAEKWVAAAAIVPNKKDMTAAAKALGFKKLQPWMANLKSKDLHNSALVAVDYQTGELVAYVGSADYYATIRPSQPSSPSTTWSARATASRVRRSSRSTTRSASTTARSPRASMLMDVGTDFGGGYTPNDADHLERGPVRVRNALQFSLNIPAVKTMAINTPDHVFAQGPGVRDAVPGRKRNAELALALGVQEVRPVDLVTAYGTLANGGKEIAPHDDPGHQGHATARTSSRRTCRPPASRSSARRRRSSSPTSWPATPTRPSTRSGASSRSPGPDGRRPATLKTGTNNDAKDLNAYGYIAPPTDAGRKPGAYALAVGVWNGNCDNSLVSTARSPRSSPSTCPPTSGRASSRGHREVAR